MTPDPEAFRRALSGLDLPDGLGIEPLAPLSGGLLPEITRADENPGTDPLLSLRRRFGAKAAVPKAQYALTGRIPSFRALHLDLAWDVARLADHPETATFPPKLVTASLRVRQWVAEGMIRSLCLIPAECAD